MKILFTIVILSFAVMLPAQGVLIDTAGGQPHPSAILEVQSTNKGLLIPRMNALERLVIPSPETGLLVYDIDVNSLFYFDGGDWVEFASSRRGLRDRDFDTSIKVEEAIDEDTIRVKVKNEDVFKVTNQSLILNEGKTISIGTDNWVGDLHISDPDFADIRLDGMQCRLFMNNGFLLSGTQDMLLGAYDPGKLKFQTGNTTGAMTILPNGNIGMGTVDPEASLHLWKGNSGDAGSAQSDMILESDGSMLVTIAGNLLSGYGFRDNGDDLYAGFYYSYSGEEILLVQKGVVQCVISDDGLFGISESFPQAMIHIKQNGSGEEALRIENDNNSDHWAFEIGTNDLALYHNNNNKGRFDDATGNYLPNSDARLKSDVQNISPGVLGRLMQLVPKTYAFKEYENKERRSYGFIAQEVKNVFPDVVSYTDDEHQLHSLDYTQLGVLAIKAVQELTQEKESLEAKVSSLEEKLERLEKNLNTLMEND